MSELVLEKKKDETLTTTPNCPVCGNKTRKIDTHFHCGKVVLLSEVNDHYLGFGKLQDQLPKTGCPICGRPMRNIGKWKHWPVTPNSRVEGLVRMYCDQQDHYCYVTKEWYIKNHR